MTQREVWKAKKYIDSGVERFEGVDRTWIKLSCEAVNANSPLPKTEIVWLVEEGPLRFSRPHLFELAGFCSGCKFHSVDSLGFSGCGVEEISHDLDHLSLGCGPTTIYVTPEEYLGRSLASSSGFWWDSLKPTADIWEAVIAVSR